MLQYSDFFDVRTPDTGNFLHVFFLFVSGVKPTEGVADMTVISDIDEHGINQNLHVRYKRDNIYVGTFSFFLLNSGVWWDLNPLHLNWEYSTLTT